MLLCEFALQVDGSQRCERCGFSFRPAVEGAIYRRCPAAPRGLGDLVRSVTDALGIPHCGGCDERQRWLNEAVPFSRPFSEQENGGAS